MTVRRVTSAKGWGEVWHGRKHKPEVTNTVFGALTLLGFSFLKINLVLCDNFFPLLVT